VNYRQTLDYLYTALPMFQKVGGAAFNKGLDKTLQLLEVLDNPHYQFKSVHIAGTNGKGSVSSMLSAVLQSAGYKTGLYTSPHLKEFTERIRINGIEIPESNVISFVQKMLPELERIKPSFFEMTVAMAFDYFAREKVDIAIIEVGMGGRLDSTNVILPELSIITNISFDHQQFLGDTISLIAGEKAEIIKPGIPAIISESHEESRPVFEKVAAQKKASIQFADDQYKVLQNGLTGCYQVYKEDSLLLKDLECDLKGAYQCRNIPVVIAALELLKARFAIDETALRKGLGNVTGLTGLKGRWQVLKKEPLVICDTGHNEAGIAIIIDSLRKLPHGKLIFVLGMVADKDVEKVLRLLPSDAGYIFCQPSIQRALPAAELGRLAKEKVNIASQVVPDVNEALRFAESLASASDIIFVGGSTFVVADLAIL